MLGLNFFMDALTAQAKLDGDQLVGFFYAYFRQQNLKRQT